MLKAHRGKANHDLISWLQASNWHYCLRLPCDVLLHGPHRYPVEVSYLWPPLGEAVFYRNVGLWQDGVHRCNLVLANVKGVKEPWAVITDEPPTLLSLWQYGLRFRVEELFLDSKSGAKEARRLSHSLSCCTLSGLCPWLLWPCFTPQPKAWLFNLKAYGDR
ncbi:transposase [Moorena sp. SIO4G3]|uniref:transposase n=1 Tax=Moorena sp. SIO4G3 TaxID=2607821 RepID=UPI0025D28E1F|nr:transposase [Moorena sp. SIO4G3]